jgi:hypothetical protein
MHAKILHHLFTIVNTDVIKAPLWDTAALGPSAFPNNAAFVHQHVSQLLTTSFPNLRPQQVEVHTFPHARARVSKRQKKDWCVFSCIATKYKSLNFLSPLCCLPQSWARPMSKCGPSHWRSARLQCYCHDQMLHILQHSKGLVHHTTAMS